MNYQTFSNLQFRPLLKNSFHSIHIDLRDPSGEKISFVSVGITRLVLMIRKASNIHFWYVRYYKTVALRQVEIPYYRAVGRQRGRGFGALAHVIGRTAIPFLRKYVVPAAKRIGADILEFAAPEIGEVFSGRKSFKSAAKSVGKQTPKKQLGEGSHRGGSKQKRIIPTKSTKQSSRSRRDIFTNISRWTCQATFFGTNLLWQCLEILEGKSQLLTMSCPHMNKKFIQLPHLMKTA